MEYVYHLISLIKRWSSYFGLALDSQNFEDTFYQLLHDKNYDEALKLASQHKYLDIDLVYKFKWRNTGITIQLINNVLGKIQDKLWTIYECVQTVPMTYDACRCLLEFGLKEANLRLLYELGNETTNQHTYGKHEGKLYIYSKTKHQRDQARRPLLDEDVQDDAILGLIDFEHLNDQQKELCRCRQNLLRYQHSLLAYGEILGDSRTIQHDFDHVFYAELRQKPPLEACIDFANSGDPHAVEICLNYYTDDLKPHLLTLLSNFPETLSPYLYRNLLPCLRAGGSVFEWRSLNDCKIQQIEQDWSSFNTDSALGLYLRDKNETFAREFYDRNSYLKKYLTTFDSDILTQWFVDRALEMEHRTLLLSSAIQLLNLGIELNIRDLNETLAELIEFERIVYDCCTMNNIYLSYAEFKKLPDIERLLLMTGKDYSENEAKYKLLANALVDLDDTKGVMSVKILEYIIDLRKRDLKIQKAYLERHM